jgi:YVTN family beta-propeller protein
MRQAVYACVLTLLAGAPAAAQEYTVIGTSHADNSITEVNPVTGFRMRRFIYLPDDLRGETHEGILTRDSKTAYIAVPYKKQVLIFDVDTFKPRGVIESEFFSRPPHERRTSRFVDPQSTTADPHGLALNKDESKLYITLNVSNVPGVAVYDVKAGKVTKKIDTPVGNWLAVDPVTDKLYLPAGASDKVVVIDTKTDKVMTTIDVAKGSGPAGVGFASGSAFVNGDRDGSITVIDIATDKIVKVIQPGIKGGGRTIGSPDGRFAVATAGPKAFVIDAKTKEIVATLTISPEDMKGGHGYPLFSPDGNTLHVLNESSDNMVSFDMRDLKAPGKWSAESLGNNFFGGGIRVLAKK